jgi:hypothetical protein
MRLQQFLAVRRTGIPRRTPPRPPKLPGNRQALNIHVVEN